MFKIYKLSLGETIDFAATELKKYLRMMMPDCGGITIEYDPKAVDGFRLGLLEDFGLPNEAEDPVLDDIVHIETTECGGILAGSNPRSVLFAVYRLLKLNGCRFLLPGTDGEFIPRKELTPQSYHKLADNRVRAHTIEGDPTLEQALGFVDYHAKQELNGFGLLGIFDYHRRYYRHRRNEKNRPAEEVDFATVRQWHALLETELIKRGMNIRDGGHEFVSFAAGFDPDDLPLYRSGQKVCPPEIREGLAMLNGVRDLNRRHPGYTNFCMSRADMRTKLADKVVERAMNNTQVLELDVPLADTSHNHCECPACIKKRPSDWMVDLMNEIDEKLTEKGLPTKIVLAAYVDCSFPPEVERLKNPGRFILQFCPISRKYTSSITADTVYPEPPKFVHNAWEPPRGIEACVALFKQWQKVFPGTCIEYEYHFWRHQFRDPGMMAMSRRVYEDMKSLKIRDLSGCMEDGSNRNFFPTGFMKHIWAATLLDSNVDYEAELADYFSHCYGEDWQEVRTYLEKITETFDHSYMSGEKSADPERGMFYNPEQAKKLAMVKEIATAMREVIKKHMQMPTRVQNVCWRLLLRHTEYCERVAEIISWKCQGFDQVSANMAEQFFEDFGKYEYEIERYFDHGLAMDSWDVFVRLMPRIEL